MVDRNLNQAALKNRCQKSQSRFYHCVRNPNNAQCWVGTVEARAGRELEGLGGGPGVREPPPAGPPP